MQITQRLTAKVGPLPVYAWALVLLIGGYLVYRLVGTSASTSGAPTAATGPISQDPDSTPVSPDDSGSPPASGQGNAADNMNGELLSQLSGFQGTLDSLTAAVQSSPAFWPGSGDSGSGSTIANDGTTWAPPVPRAPVPAPVKKPAAVKKPAPAPAFGGILRTAKTKTGGTLTYYRSGRIVQQEKGKTAYVVHK